MCSTLSGKNSNIWTRFVLGKINASNLYQYKNLLFCKELTLSQEQIIISSKLEHFGDENFKFDEYLQKVL